MRASLAVLILSCVPANHPSCTSPCGMISFDPEMCAELPKAEALSIAALETVEVNYPSLKARGLCTGISGTLVSWHREAVMDSWTDQWGRQVGGLSYCAGGRPYEIELGTPEYSENALTHELAHAAMACGGADHTIDGVTWEQAGINRAVSDVHTALASDPVP